MTPSAILVFRSYRDNNIVPEFSTSPYQEIPLNETINSNFGKHFSINSIKLLFN